MRPVIRPNGAYHTATQNTTGGGGVGKNQKTRCLALCIEEEIDRLELLIVAIGGPTDAMRHALAVAVNAVAAPVYLPALVVPAVAAGVGVAAYAGFAAGGYPVALAAIPAANRAIIDNYFHYLIIRKNLNYNIGANTFAVGLANRPRLAVADIPYAASAMQDARTQVGVNSVFSDGMGAVAIGVPPLGAVRQFTTGEINTHINSFYSGWQGLSYADAQKELVNELGPYCAYCEANIKTRLDVEHILPKGAGNTVAGVKQGVSSLTTSWFNYLPSCSNCNSAKGASPKKDIITGYASVVGDAFLKDDQVNLNPVAAQAIGGSDTRITDREYSRLVGRYYQFPLEQSSYQNTGFLLWDEANSAVDNTTLNNQLGWRVVRVDEVHKYLVVNTAGPLALPVLRNFSVHLDYGGVGATVVPTPGPVANTAKVSRMAGLCGLNTNANADRRTIERTEAWFMALAAVDQVVADLAALGNGLANIVYETVFNSWKKNLITTIKEKGFLSVWLKILTAFPHPLIATTVGAAPNFVGFGPFVNGGVAGNAMSLVQDIAQEIYDSRYFPGTDWTQVP
ncbi:MAG: HNH endonuclease signature motif containing protein [Bacteroidota bacterium]